MKALGVDVGIQTCGYVVCEVRKLQIAIIKEGHIKPKQKQSLPEKLNYIFDELNKPIVILLENLF